MSSGPGLKQVEVEWVQSILGITKLNESLPGDNQEILCGSWSTFVSISKGMSSGVHGLMQSCHSTEYLF